MSAQSKTETRKEQILKAAERIFASKGYHDSTIAEIAKEAHVSEGSIYEYFETKEKLLFSIPEAFSNKVHEQNKFHLQLIRGAANRLRATIYLYLHVWQEYPDYAVINLLILKGNENFRQTEGYRFIREGFRGTTQIIKEGIASGEFRADIEPYVIRSVLMGAVDHVTTNWLLSNRKRSLVDLVDPIMDLVMTGLCNEPQYAAGGTPRWDHWPVRRGRPVDGGRDTKEGHSTDAKKPE